MANRQGSNPCHAVLARISLFNPAYAKTIFVLRKQEEESVQLVYPFTDLQDHDQVVHFMESFQNWLKDSEGDQRSDIIEEVEKQQ